jgi:hypothetical protein
MCASTRSRPYLETTVTKLSWPDDRRAFQTTGQRAPAGEQGVPLSGSTATGRAVAVALGILADTMGAPKEEKTTATSTT